MKESNKISGMVYCNDNIIVSAYIDGILRGTRPLRIKEARCVVGILRREYPKMFALPIDKRKYLKFL
jgi:hypothetical protein